VHAKRDGDMHCLAKCSVLSGIMAFTEVINTIAGEEQSSLRVGHKRRGCSQVTNDNMHRSRWVIRRDRNMTTGFVTILCQFTHCVSSHGDIGPW